MEKELYTISDVAKRFKISTELLRKYERHGLIVPVRTANSRYRFYGDDDILKIEIIRYLVEKEQIRLAGISRLFRTLTLEELKVRSGIDKSGIEGIFGTMDKPVFERFSKGKKEPRTYVINRKVVVNLLHKDNFWECLLIVLGEKSTMGPKYSHEGRGMYYVLAGEVVFEIGNEKKTLNKGGVISFSSETSHTIHNNADERAILLNIFSPPTFI